MTELHKFLSNPVSTRKKANGLPEAVLVNDFNDSWTTSEGLRWRVSSKEYKGDQERSSLMWEIVPAAAAGSSEAYPLDGSIHKI